jgi:MFS family permease
MAAAPKYARGPLFLLAGCHASLHWVLATFYVLLPFLQQSLSLTYSETGLLASTVHFASFAANVPSGAVVDMTGRRVACQLVALVCASIAVLGLAVTDDFWLVAACVGVLAAMNTLWHPAAISYLSDQYRDHRGLALSFHTVGASIGDALAPIAMGTVIAAYGWQAATVAAAAPPLCAAAVILLMMSPRAGGSYRGASASATGFRDYVAQMRGLLSNVTVWIICVLAGLRGTAQVGLRTFVPLYVANEMGMNAVWVGIALLAFQGAGAVVTPFAGHASDRFGRAPVLMLGLGLSAVLIACLPDAPNIWAFLVLVALVGASILTLRPVVQGWALDQTPPELGGSTISLLFTLQAAFSMAVPVLGGMVADSYGLDATFRMLALMAAIASAAAFWADRYQRRRSGAFH